MSVGGAADAAGGERPAEEGTGPEGAARQSGCDGECDAVCNNPACNLDGGDCDSVESNRNSTYASKSSEATEPGLCSTLGLDWRGDGECDRLCNSTVCGFDGGDCCLEVHLLDFDSDLYDRELEVTFRRDPENYRPRINKADSVKDTEQKASGNYFFMDDD